MDFPELKTRLEKLIESQPANRFLYSVLIDFATAEKDIEKARGYLLKLKIIDRLRENYYQWRLNNLK